jgi:uncharacterized protein YprB with RNaseH-like and TPR domain
MKRRAYIDIETTGLSGCFAELTVVGIGLEKGNSVEITQFIEKNLRADRILDRLAGVDEIYSYNGSRFDLPFIIAKLGVDLKRMFRHTDLMYDCWRHNLKGGLKAVERKLGIDRKLRDIDGRKAVALWWQYVNNYDRVALATLLEYNREDVGNLRTLRVKLGVE